MSFAGLRSSLSSGILPSDNSRNICNLSMSMEEPSSNDFLACGKDCSCGDDCKCTETLCRCEASSVINSLNGGSLSAKNSPTAAAAGSCCSKKKSKIEDTTASYSGDPLQAPSTADETDSSLEPLLRLSPEPSHKAELIIEGMTCSMCSQAIETAVNQLSGIHSISISLTTDTAIVEWEDSLTTGLDEIREQIEAIGYDVVEARMIDDSEEKQDAWDDTVQERWRDLRQRQADKVDGRKNAFLYSLIGTVPILFLTMILPHILPHTILNRHITLFHREFEVEALMLWILATPVQFVAGWEFYKMAFHGIQSGRAGMDVLVALGTTASYGYALYGAMTGDDHLAHFFETSAVLISFVLAGKWMQALAVRRTSDALTQLMELQSTTAVKVTPLNDDQYNHNFNPLKDPYKEDTVAIQEVHTGDMVKIIRGASIPADGKMAFGEMAVDESMVTGESVPVLKTPGSIVLGGTICVESSAASDQTTDKAVGAAFVHVTGVGSSTALAQIVQLVQEAQTRAVPIQSFADQISAVFVPAVSTIALLTFMVWYALCSSQVVPSGWYEDLGEDPATFSLMFGIACLVISCPCALGLATPTAVMVGTGVGAKFGVLMKGGEALEIASNVDSVVFDKTGTLTKGSPVITDFVRLHDHSDMDGDENEVIDDYLLWLLGSLERTSEHPLARAVVAYAEEQLDESYLKANPFVQPTHFRALTGRGASGMLRDRVSVAVGNRAFASVLDLVISAQAEECMERLEREGKTAIIAAVNDKVTVIMGIADELKQEAPASVAYLRDEMGVDVWMVTGDNGRTANAIAQKLGLPSDRVISEALPAAKLQQVRRLQAEGRVVAMVGDGVNDSPALAQADVGMSLGTGAEIAAEASDMVLVKGAVTDVCTALHLSRVIFRRIQWNFLWSLLYNCLGIPIAAGVFYPFVRARLPPTVAAIAMALSSISVVCSSLSLRLYQPPAVMERGPSRATTVWRRSMRRWASRGGAEGDGSDHLMDALLPNDHLTASEITERVDNRTASNMEEGK